MNTPAPRPLPTRLLACTAGACLAASALAQTQPRYTVVDLGMPAGASATGVSETGHISGIYFATSGQRRAFRWNSGTNSDLGTLGTIAQALAVNDAGSIVGYSVDAQNRQRAVRFAGTTPIDLGTLQGGIHANANDVNNVGWSVGMSQKRLGNETYQRAALWRNGSVQDLGTFGGEYSEANAINNSGQVVGWAWYALPTRYQHAFLWSDATGMIDLGTLGGTMSNAQDISDNGVVVGTAHSAQPTSLPFVWTAQTGMTALPVPPNADAYASAVNDEGTIVGNAFFFIECTGGALIWQDGQVQDLNNLVDHSTGWSVGGATDINNQGHISAIARRGQESYRAVLLVPIPPATPEKVENFAGDLKQDDGL